MNDERIGFILDFLEGKIVYYDKSNFEYVNTAAEDAARLSDHPDNIRQFGRCLGICYAFGNSVSLVLENKDVSSQL